MAEASPQEAKKKDIGKGGKEKNTATLSKLSNAIKGSEKLDVEGTDLLELLSHLEGELQARDVAIAALKSEQTKRILYGCSRGTDNPNSPLTALNRDKHTRKDASQLDEEVRGSTLLAESQISALQNVIQCQKIAAQKMTACLRESESQRTTILQQLEEEKAKHERDTAQGDDITYELEKERIRLKQDLETEVAEKGKMEVALKESLNTLEEEKSKQKQIVMVLLADRKKLMKLYLEEKKRSEDLAGMLSDEKSKMDTMAAGLEEESKRSLAMEAELEKHMAQFGSERQQLRDKQVSEERRYRDLEDALRKARADVEHFKKQLSEAHRIAMSQQSGGPGPIVSPYPGVTSTSGVSPGSGGQAQQTYANFPVQPGPGLMMPATSVATNNQQQKYHLQQPSSVGYPGHPANAVNPTNISHMDQESFQNTPDINSYSQIGVKPGNVMKPSPPSVSVPSSVAARKPSPASAVSSVDSSSSIVASNRKGPVLGKGVPPPVPPNKPSVPVKKDMFLSKRSDSVVENTSATSKSVGSSVVSGLQGLKFGISLPLSSSDSNKGIKPLSDSNVPAAKKFFNNIESKS